MPDVYTLWSIFKDSTTIQAVLGALIGFIVMQVFQQRKTMPNVPMDERFMPSYRSGPSSIPMPGELPFGPAPKKQKGKQSASAQKDLGDAASAERKRIEELERKLFEQMLNGHGDETDEDKSEEEQQETKNSGQQQQQLQRKKRSPTLEEAPQTELRRRPVGRSAVESLGKAVTDRVINRDSEDDSGDDEVHEKENEADIDEGQLDDLGEDDEADRGMLPYSNITYPESEMLNRAQAFFDILNQRRSCRQFSDRPVDAELLKLLVRSAGTSPSGAHTEPWTYVCVTNPAIKRRIRDIVEEEEEINYARRMGPAWKADLAKLRTTWEKPYLTEAPVIVVLMRQAHGWRRGQEEKRQHYYSEISVSISAGLFLAAVQNVGLCTLTSTPMNAGPALRRLLGRPPNEKVHLLLPLGYAADNAEVPNLTRKHLDNEMVCM